jgi:hypothetical protein
VPITLRTNLQIFYAPKSHFLLFHYTPTLRSVHDKKFWGENYDACIPSDVSAYMVRITRIINVHF